jgi:hypothetical protein
LLGQFVTGKSLELEPPVFRVERQYVSLGLCAGYILPKNASAGNPLPTADNAAVLAVKNRVFFTGTAGPGHFLKDAQSPQSAG